MARINSRPAYKVDTTVKVSWYLRDYSYDNSKLQLLSTVRFRINKYQSTYKSRKGPLTDVSKEALPDV